MKPLRLIRSGADYRAWMRQERVKLTQQRIYERARWLISVQLGVREEDVWKVFLRAEVLAQAETAEFQAEYLRRRGRRLDGDFYGGQDI